MPNRFSTAFRRKSASGPDELLQQQQQQEQQPPQLAPLSTAETAPSFRVLERNSPVGGGRGFDGGARMARAATKPVPNPTGKAMKPEEDDWDKNNMFAGLKPSAYRGSGGSNTTKGTSTDTSSRHSNASTTPSSADMAQARAEEEARAAKKAPPPPAEAANRAVAKSGSGFLDKAGRTFSFGMQRKSNPSTPDKKVPESSSIPDLAPLPSFSREDGAARSRATTASTTSTATPKQPQAGGGTGLDLGGDFGAMFSTGVDERSTPGSQRTPGGLTLDTNSGIKPSDSFRSQADSVFMSPSSAISPPFSARHKPSFEYRTSGGPGGEVHDADAKLLADSFAATRFLSGGSSEAGPSSRYGQGRDFSGSSGRKPVAAEFESEDNMFAGTTTVGRFSSRPSYRMSNRAPSPPRGGKVMTAAEFEKLQKEKNREHLEKAIYGGSADDDDDDDINYDDDYDEEEKVKTDAKFRRNKQQAMLAYRQKNMKTTGTVGQIVPGHASRPSLASSLSAPQVPVFKTPSPEPPQASDEDDDEDIPLAILQAHGFPSKNRSASRLSHAGSASMSNIRGQSQAQAVRPVSAIGESASTAAKRTSTLPVFARNLPQDLPAYVGANVSRTALRESLTFGGGSGHLQPPAQNSPMHPAGLVGIIANEERAKAMRRGGSPSAENQRLDAAIQGFDPLAPHQRSNSQQGMHRMPQHPAMSPAEQAQAKAVEQMNIMTNFMQTQMAYMNMVNGFQPGL